MSAKIGYYITPEASLTLCDTSPVGDVTACLGIYHGPKGGLYVDIYAYYRVKKCKISWWSIKCYVRDVVIICSQFHIIIIVIIHS